MSHALVIAAIFGSYLILMIGLGVYIWSTGRHQDRDESGDEDRDPDSLLAAA